MKTKTKTTWRKVKLGEVVVERGSVSGPFGSNIHSKFYTSFGVPIIRGNNLTINMNGGRYIDKDYIFLSEEKAKELSQSEALPEDIIITARGTIGQTGIIPKNSKYRKYILSANQLRFRINKNIADPFFVYYQLSSKQIVKLMQNIQVGVGVPNLNLKTTRELLITIPSLIEQKQIASILSAFDDKIELNNKISRTLEEMASAIFKEWFVRFKFLGHEKVKIVNSELGKIPEGWEVKKIKDTINVKSGFAFKSGDFVNHGKYNLVTIKNVHDGEFKTECQSRLESLPQNMPSYCLLNTGDILLSLTGNIGRVCLFYGENYLLNQRVAKLESKENNFYAFTYLLFRSLVLKSQMEALAGGSAQQNLSPVETGELKIVVPSNTIIDEFSKIANKIVQRIINLKLENQKLSSLRDLLLPKLMSGEVRMKA